METSDVAAVTRQPGAPGRAAAWPENEASEARAQRVPETPVDRGGALWPRETSDAPREPVDEASELSFPASDPPFWAPSWPC
ncbi:hypothetical protein WME76_20425 [Sorangium sp. So ce119]|uniref:hypothetical protein n=1 Tax=Sorangium sp. So ce119 TaxID=3133279 RepID=UPI003F643954